MAFNLADLLPMAPAEGPPLPRFFDIYWPWRHAIPPTYTCNYCGATFATEEELAAHIAKYHGTAPPPLGYSCPYCDQSFASLPELIDHVATVHPDKPPLGPITIAWE